MYRFYAITEFNSTLYRTGENNPKIDMRLKETQNNRK